MKKKILFVDNTESFLGIISDILRENGYLVKPFNKVSEAMHYIENGGNYDFALFDYDFGNARYDGEDLLNLSVDKNKDVPVIMLSSYANGNQNRFYKARYFLNYGSKDLAKDLVDTLDNHFKFE
ncbi:MAG: response regulator [Nanoarchaeota archaeon]|nr:response regulator [Nanoarchaeota archaeon]